MDNTDAHLDALLAAEGPIAPSPTAEEEERSEDFRPSPPRIDRDDSVEYLESPKFPENPVEEPNQEQRDQDEFAEEAEFAEVAY